MFFSQTNVVIMHNIFSIFLLSILTTLSVHAMREGDSKTSFVGNFYLEQSLSAHKTNLPSAFGTSLIPESKKKHFFQFTLVHEHPKAIRDLFHFLIDAGFVAHIGIVESSSLTNNPTPPRRAMKREIERFFPGFKAEGQLVFLIPNTENPNNAFDSIYQGLFFRDRSNDMLPDNELLGRDDEAQGLLDKIRDIDNSIAQKLRSLQDLLSSTSSLSITDRLNAILSNENLPLLSAAKLRVMRESGRFSEISLLAIIAHRLRQNIIVHEERRKAVENIFPSRLDIMLLYSFFVLEESMGKVMEGRILGEKGEDFGILSAYAEDNGLSMSKLLKPMAHEVLSGLNFFADSTEELVAENPQPGDESLPSSAPPASMPEPTAEKAPIDEKPRKPITWLYPTRHKAHALKLEKGHRLLDTLARLLAGEISHLYSPAGSVSVAIVNDKESNDQLIISTKKFVPEWLINNAIKKVYENSESFYEKVADHNKFIKAQRNFLLDNRGHSRFKREREKIDRIKFIRALKKETPDSALELRFKNLFSRGHDALNFQVLPNPLNIGNQKNLMVFHSEINLANFIFANQKPLDTIASSLGDLPYQYIGGSLKNCGKCNAMFRGWGNIRGINEDFNRYKILIFTAGNYHFVDGGYTLPHWSMNTNHATAKHLTENLKGIPSIDTISPEQRSSVQQIDLSESDDEI